MSKIDSKLLETNQEKVRVIVWVDKEKYHENEQKKLDELGDVRYEYDIIPAVSMEVLKNQLRNLADQDFVKKIVVDNPVRIFRAESVPLIRADSARADFGLNGTGITVAVIDTGVYNHTEFQNPNRIVAQRCTITPSSSCPNGDVNNATDGNGHGTHVAGIVAGTNGVGTNASILAIKALSDDGSGLDSDIIAGINWAVQNGAKIISISAGICVDPSDSLCGTPNHCLCSLNCYDVPSSVAIDNATENGVVAIVAAGNQGSTSKTIGAPACAKTAIAVGSTRDSGSVDSISSFSSRGPTYDNRTKPDLVAPGQIITSAKPSGVSMEPACIDYGDNYAICQGTSQATPFVSGVVALVIEKYNKTFGYFPESGRVKAISLTSVNTTQMNSEGYIQRNNVYGSGRVDAYEMLRIVNFTKNDTIVNGQTRIYEINVTSSNVRVTLYWPENSTTSNNLDLIVRASNSTNYTNPTDANDTVEQV
ncbi:MAG: S8 family serine peptidase, partial [Thaumarchaeota archaeon]|nr:S8 family serine peptidase [Nitrososphaerota archaeon]